MVKAYKVSFWNGVLNMEQSETASLERVKRLKSMPFVHNLKVNEINVPDQEADRTIYDEGGVTKSFRKMWAGL